MNSESLPALISRAAQQLASATTAAEVLEAREAASFAYDAAKATARFARVKQAHDDVLSVVYRAQADALDIEAQAKRRLADEYDAAQERGDVQRAGGDRVSNVPDENNAPTVTDLGLNRKDIHEARIVRDAEQADPGIVRRTVDAAVDAGREPTKAEVRRAIAPATPPRRRPLTDDINAVVVDLVRATKRAAVIRQDDRFDGREIARKHGSDLLRAQEALTDWVEAVAPAAAAQSPEALLQWKGSLGDMGDTLHRVARSLGGES